MHADTSHCLKAKPHIFKPGARGPSPRRRLAAVLGGSRGVLHESRRRLQCRASAETDFDRLAKPAVSRVRAPKTAGIGPSSAPRPAPVPEPLSAVDSKLMAMVKVALGGAVAAALVAAGYHFSAEVLNSIEAVPPLADLELFLGAVVTAQALSLYLGNKDAREEIDQRVTSAVASASENVADALGLEHLSLRESPQVEQTPSPQWEGEERRGVGGDGSPAGSTVASAQQATGGLAKVEPTMLEVELRSLVDASMAPPTVEASASLAPSAVTVDRQALIEAMADFIRHREKQVWEGHTRLREELEASEAIRHSLAELQKSKEARRARREAEAARLARLQNINDGLHLVQSTDTSAESGGELMPSPVPETKEEQQAAASNQTQAEDAGHAEHVDELEEAFVRARKFRERLDAMRRSREERWQEET